MQKRPKRMPTVLTHDQVKAVLQELTGVSALIGRLLYGSGMRGIEAVRLRIKDLDIARLQNHRSQCEKATRTVLPYCRNRRSCSWNTIWQLPAKHTIGPWQVDMRVSPYLTH